MNCPLCHTKNAENFTRDAVREYFRCANCGLTFVPEAEHIALADEKAEYDRHQNSPDDHRYRKFLSRLFEPLHSRLPPGSRGLDFGSGPGPTLSVMFVEAGHVMSIYDPFYASATDCLDRDYDFVTASEVIEHFRDPAVELDRIWAMVKPNGFLGVMTKLALDRESFDKWHYKDDPTHVSFFSVTTLEWLARKWNAELTLVGTDVAIWRKEV